MTFRSDVPFSDIEGAWNLDYRFSRTLWNELPIAFGMLRSVPLQSGPLEAEDPAPHIISLLGPQGANMPAGPEQGGDTILRTRAVADAAFASLERFAIPPTPANYAVWFEYHAGDDLQLHRTLDVLISNGAVFDHKTLHDLYAGFLDRGAESVRETSARALQTLESAVSIAKDSMHSMHPDQFGSQQLDAHLNGLKDIIGNLVQDLHTIAGRTQYLDLHMRESSGRIEALERDLERVVRESSLDGLTGISNRKTFDASLRKMAGDAMNTGDELGLLMVDIDHFKRINDSWGHLAGDSVLCHLAKVLRKAIRGDDFVARYGGEEFAVILPRTDLQSAVTVGQNLRDALRREPPEIAPNHPLCITISIGAACYDFGEPLADWIAHADAALYQAKKEGRDRVECARF